MGAWVLLIVAPCSVLGSDLPSLMEQLRLVRYRSGTKPADFRGPTLDTRPVSLAALRGKVVLVNFWATWCVECRPELPVLERLHRELGSRGLAVVGVNARERRETIAHYVREIGLSFPVVLDPDGAIAAQYGVIGLPATFLIDRDGRAVAFAIGPREWGGGHARALLAALLTEPRPPWSR